MNDATSITPSAKESSLRDLIVKAQAIEIQIQASTDDEELADLCGDLEHLNNRVIRAPVASLEEVREKADYLLATDDPLDAGIIEPLLESLVGRAAA